jgi:hypothetical protein
MRLNVPDREGDESVTSYRLVRPDDIILGRTLVVTQSGLRRRLS